MDIITTTPGIELLLRWLHFMAGITWIGMLYYFNFVQTPYFGTELGGQARSAMVRGLVPDALWWFRWGAMFTFLSGVAMIALRWGHGEFLGSPRMTAVLTGGAMGTLMWANVWFVIWPAQKIAIASANAVAAGGEADPQAAALAPRASRASRTNTLFSIPMLFFMGAASHYAIGGAVTSYWLIALVVILLVEANALVPASPLQKPLGTVSGTLYFGFALTLVLYLLQKLILG
jgi:uncharacterized membrane protein